MLGTVYLIHTKKKEQGVHLATVSSNKTRSELSFHRLHILVFKSLCVTITANFSLGGKKIIIAVAKVRGVVSGCDKFAAKCFKSFWEDGESRKTIY